MTFFDNFPEKSYIFCTFREWNDFFRYYSKKIVRFFVHFENDIFSMIFHKKSSDFFTISRMTYFCTFQWWLFSIIFQKNHTIFFVQFSCPPRTFLPALCRIFLDDCAPDNVLEVTARAITYYLDVSAECTRRIVAVDGAIKAICNRLVVVEISSRTSKDLAEQCIKVRLHFLRPFSKYSIRRLTENWREPKFSTIRPKISGIRPHCQGVNFNISIPTAKRGKIYCRLPKAV